MGRGLGDHWDFWVLVHSTGLVVFREMLFGVSGRNSASASRAIRITSRSSLLSLSLVSKRAQIPSDPSRLRGRRPEHGASAQEESYQIVWRRGRGHRDLRGHGDGRQFGLLQTGPDSSTVFDCFAGVVVESRSKTTKGFQFFKLCVRELQVSRDGTVDPSLCLSTDTRNGFPTSTAGRTPSSNREGER